MLRRAFSAVPAICLLALAAIAPAAAGAANAYHVTKLVSDQPGVAAHMDPNLVNAWGLVAGPSTPWWVADNETDLSTLYTGDGDPLPLVVNVPGGPTGIVFNGGSGFVVNDGTNSGAARFVFDTEAGTIRGWSPGVPPPPLSTQTEVGADRSGVGAIYKGLAIASTDDGDRLYAADFHNARVLRRPQAPAAVRAVRDPEHRRQDLRGLRQAGPRRGGRGCRPRAWLRGRVRHGRHAPPARGYPGAAERPLGPGHGPGWLRPVRWRPARRELRQRPDQRVRRTPERLVRARREAAGAERPAARDRRPVGAPVRQRQRRRVGGLAVLHGGTG